MAGVIVAVGFSTSQKVSMHMLRWALSRAILFVIVFSAGSCRYVFTDPATRFAEQIKHSARELMGSHDQQRTFTYIPEHQDRFVVLFLPNRAITADELSASKFPLMNKIHGTIEPGSLIIVKDNADDASMTTYHRNFITLPDSLLGIVKVGQPVEYTLKKVDYDEPKLIAMH